MLNQLTENCCTGSANCSISSSPRTIGQVMDERIANCRKAVEQECIAKAKLEALGVLDHHAALYNAIYDHDF